MYIDWVVAVFVRCVWLDYMRFFLHSERQRYTCSWQAICIWGTAKRTWSSGLHWLRSFLQSWLRKFFLDFSWHRFEIHRWKIRILDEWFFEWEKVLLKFSRRVGDTFGSAGGSHRRSQRLPGGSRVPVHDQREISIFLMHIYVYLNYVYVSIR